MYFAVNSTMQLHPYLQSFHSEVFGCRSLAGALGHVALHSTHLWAEFPGYNSSLFARRVTFPYHGYLQHACIRQCSSLSYCARADLNKCAQLQITFASNSFTMHCSVYCNLLITPCLAGAHSQHNRHRLQQWLHGSPAAIRAQ